MMAVQQPNGIRYLEKGLHSAVCLAFVCFNTYPLSSFLAVSLFLSPSAEAMWKFSYLCDSPLHLSHHHHPPLVCPSLHLLGHPSIDPSFVRQSSKDVLFSFNSTTMNQSLVAARGILAALH